MDLRAQQVLYLKWLGHHTSRTQSQIKRACKALLPDQKSSFYKIHDPLYRLGLIEFVGDGTYQKTAPLLLSYKNQHVAGINFSKQQMAMLPAICGNLEEIHLGCFRINGSKNTAESIAKICGVPLQEANPLSILQKIPSLKKVVQQWTETPADRATLFFDLARRAWSLSKLEHGLCKASEQAQVLYLKTAGDHFLKIPSNQINPEMRLVAESYAKVLNDEIPFSYCADTQILTTCRLNFPVIIERALCVASLHKEEGINGSFKCRKYSNVSLAMFRQLTRIYKK